MWDFYYDTVNWEQKIGEDSFGNNIYKPSEEIKVRYIGGKDVMNIDGEKIGIKHKREYHSKDKLELGDKIDGAEVKELPKPARGLDGKIYYWEVVVG